LKAGRIEHEELAFSDHDLREVMRLPVW